MLAFVGLSHRRTPVALRERCAVSGDERPRALAELREIFGQVVLLSTCGRLEVYADGAGHDRAAVEAAFVAWLARRAGASADELSDLVESGSGDAAVRHILRVACGLESALEGEDEILGQVRRAWLDAGLGGILSPALNTAFRLAVRTGRQARRDGHRDAWTSMAEWAAARVATEIAHRAGPRVLVAGTGPMGLRAAQTLRQRFGVKVELTLAGRNAERTAMLASQLDARPLSLADLRAAFDWADAAVVGLRTRTPLIGAADVGPRPPERPLLIVDLSLPRAVEPAAGCLPGVSLHDVDSISGTGGRCGRWDAAGRARVEQLVEQALCDHAALAERSDALTTLTALRMQAEGIRRAQLARTFRRLPHLDDEARWAVDALTRAIVNRLLHTPTLRLKADGGDAVALQVREAFGLMTERGE